MDAKSDSSIKTLDPKSTENGRVAECQIFNAPSRLLVTLTTSNSPLSCCIFLTLRRRMAILYVSWKQVRNKISHKIAKPAAMYITCLHPRVCAIAPLIAGAMAPPMSGASIIRLIALPLFSLSNMSPMIAGFRTLAATAIPVSIRAAIKILEDCDVAAIRVKKMKKMLHPCMTGARPTTSDSGAFRRGPAASPNSQIVTSRADVDEEEEWPSRSSTIRFAMGTTPMHVKVLLLC